MEVDLEKDVLTDIASGKQYPLKSIGEVQLLFLASYNYTRSPQPVLVLVLPGDATK